MPDATTAGAPDAEPVVEAPATATAEPPRPGVIAQATALLRGANGNAATIAALRADVTARDATLAQFSADLAARDSTIAGLNTQLAAYKAQETELQAAIASVEAKSKDVDSQVIHQLAAAGLPEAALPKTSDNALTPSAAELWAQADAESNPVKKGALAAQAMKITAGKVHGCN